MEKLPKIRDPYEFDNFRDEIDKNVEPLNRNRLVLIQIQERSSLEKLHYYDKHVKFGKFRKNLLILPR